MELGVWNWHLIWVMFGKISSAISKFLTQLLIYYYVPYCIISLYNKLSQRILILSVR